MSSRYMQFCCTTEVRRQAKIIQTVSTLGSRPQLILLLHPSRRGIVLRSYAPAPLFTLPFQHRDLPSDQGPCLWRIWQGQTDPKAHWSGQLPYRKAKTAYVVPGSSVIPAGRRSAPLKLHVVPAQRQGFDIPAISLNEVATGATPHARRLDTLGLWKWKECDKPPVRNPGRPPSRMQASFQS